MSVRWVADSIRSAGSLLPEGRLLVEEVWQRRHRAILRVAGLQAVGLVVFALARGTHLEHAVASGLFVAAPLALAVPSRLGRKVRSAAATVSLFAASVALVHLWGGVTEAHFHFFVMVGVVALYQDWVPFSIALVIVVLHHGVMGTMHPTMVFGTAAAVRSPWLWAGIHAAFVLAASAANLASWRLNEQQGLRDPLTGLANRTLLSETVAKLLQRRGAPLSVLFVDLDDFKDVNDSRGHAAGDQVLTAVADRLRACVRGGDQVARFGGDEFAVVVAGEPATARAVGERVLRSLADPVHVDGRQLFVHASVGIADSATAAERDPEVLLRNADLAMYLAKAQGKNRLVVFADGMDAAAREKAELLEDLGRALPEDQLVVHYQPTVGLADGLPSGYEALLRWQHPTRGLVPPMEFIPLAEDSGHIVAIGEWVLRTATAQAVEWTRRSGRPVDVAVNLSPTQLSREDVVDVVTAALDASGLAPRQLTLEVTEGVLVRDLDTVAARLGRLRALGVRIAIDDFGTGYSSLSYLRRLPVDTVKIDRSFVSDLSSGGAATTLVSSIIELARSLHLDVVAEGVETEQQAAVLRRLRCARAQGFLYARPMPVSEVPIASVGHLLPAQAAARD